MEKMLHKGMTDMRSHLSLGYGAVVSTAKTTISVNDMFFNFFLSALLIFFHFPINKDGGEWSSLTP